MIIQKNINIKENKPLNKDFYLLSFEIDAQIEIYPGNFIMLSFPERTDLFLPRPFSIFDSAQKTVRVLYKIVGKGTKYLADLNAGATLTCTIPLGNSFTAPKVNEHTFLVGGGFGVAPLHFYLRTYQNFHKELKFFIGGSSVQQLPFADIIKASSQNEKNLKFSTDDGTLGFKGFVTELLETKLNYLMKQKKNKSEKINIAIKSCGPSQMLAAINNLIHKFNKDLNISAEFSLEEKMACGFGVCSGCVVETVSGYKRVCKEGAVFNASELIFD